MSAISAPCIEREWHDWYRCSAEPVDHFVKKGGKIEDTVGRGCLCNNLSAAAGYGQRRKDGSVELPVITSGDILTEIGALIPPGATGYSAKDVIAYLTGKAQESSSIAAENAAP